jgi:transcriptional regulator with XRE-family HTH domain
MNLDLKFAILKKFRSQADFAEAVGVHESNASRVVRGRKKLKPEQAKEWATILNCDPAILLPVTETKQRVVKGKIG